MSRPVSRQRPLLPALLGIATLAIVTLLFLRSQYLPAEDPLRGDPEESGGALAATIERTVPGERLTQLTRFARDASPGLRFNAIDRLSESRSAEAVPVLEEAFADSSSTVRQRALETLADTDPERGLRLLLTGLRDEDTWIRQAAIQQLGSRTRKGKADRRIVPALIPSLDDPDASVRFLTVRLLARLTGNLLTFKANAPESERQNVTQKWKRWWTTARTQWPEATDIRAISPQRRDPAPDFRIRDLNGHDFSRVGQKGRITLLNFWGTWCPPCQAEIPDLIRLDRELRNQGVDVIGIALSEESPDSLRKWCAARGVLYPQSMAEEKLLKDFGDIHEVPVSVLIDADGAIRRRWEGERDSATFIAAINEIRQPRE